MGGVKILSKKHLLITLTAHERDANNVTIAFTMGVKALEKGHAPEILLLSDAVHLAEQGYADPIDIGEPFEPIKKLIEQFIENGGTRSEEHTSELQSRGHLVCRLLLEKKKITPTRS